MLSTIQGLMECVIYVSQGVIPIPIEGMLRISGYGGVWSYLTVWSTSRRIGVPAAKLLYKAIGPERGRYLILSSLTNISHQVDLRSMCGPCLAKTGWPMLNVHLRYKPPRSWRILFWSRGPPRQFSLLKNFRSLVVPGGGCRKGIILQWRHIKRRLSSGRPVVPENKSGCNGSVCTCTQT